MAAKPPVVLIHGACSQPAHFDAWRQMFAEAGHDCTVPALPGHAPSDRMTLRRSGFDAYLDAMRDAVKAVGGRPVLVGHSLGALVARMLATEGGIAALVLVAPLPAGRVPMPARALPAFAMAVPFVLAGLPFRPPRAAVLRLALHHLPPAEQAGIADGFVAESGRAYRDLVFGRAHVGRREVRCPVLVLHGEADRLVPASVGEGIARKHDAALEIFAGAGHWLIAPSLVPRVGGAALRFIDGLPERRPRRRQLR